ncbi:MAG: hypothetical protein ACOC2N_01605 [Spirochaetota bacterium]
MRRPLVALLVLLVPALLFVNVLQAFRYGTLERRVRELEEEQIGLIEENKRAILAISVLTSPRRIGELAEDELDLERIGPKEVIRLQTVGDRGGE